MNTKLELESALLGFLIDNPMHGYELNKNISDLSGVGLVWRVKTGKLYAMLKKLEAGGFATSSTIKNGNRPAKIVFSATEQGKKYFLDWIKEPVKHGREFRIKFLLKLYFSIKGNEKTAKHLIRSQIKETENWRRDIEKSQKEEGKEFKKIVTTYRLFQINNLIDWLEWCDKFIREQAS